MVLISKGTAAKVAAMFALAALVSLAFGQLAGVSHPDESAVMTSQESGGAGPVYRATPTTPSAPAPVLKARPATVGDGTETVPATASTGGHRDAEDDADAGIIVRMEGPANQLPAGTLMKIRIDQGLTTQGTVEGSAFSGKLLEPVERDGRILLPVGSVLAGRVTDVHGGRRISGAASIHLQPTTITLPDGTKYAMQAQVIDSDLYGATKVDREGTITRRDHPRETLSVVGVAAGSGAAAGALLGGVPGALIGAGVGAGVSTAVWLKQDRQTGVPANTRIVFALTSPMVVGKS